MLGCYKNPKQIAEDLTADGYLRTDDLGELEPWHASSVGRWFTGHLKRAGVRHRDPNQCRHTFASQGLSSYVPVEWVARQQGHTDTTMVKKQYGRWIPSDNRSMAGVVSQMMGFRRESV
ncbi:Phage integrase family protein [compost metagenome]